jgi:23S rRNA-/tRNA-specific pseudouridylate synthase
VHLAHAGHPLVADARYGGPCVDWIDGYLLHATEITWRDPRSEEPLREHCALPDAWHRALRALETGDVDPRATPS